MIDLIGGSGFIGTRLASRLESKGSPFAILDKAPSVRFPAAHRFADVRDVESLRAGLGGGPIINLAAEHRDDVRPVSLYRDVNVKGAENICRVASEKGVSHDHIHEHRCGLWIREAWNRRNRYDRALQ
jgi:GlcNAc-P-P-Und epimerase